jgi:hypothetical protein
MADKKPSFIRQLFAGAIDDAILFPYPEISAEEDRQVSKYIDQLRSYLDANLDRD